VALIAAGHAHSRVELRLVGGVLHVEWDGRGDVLLTGPCELLWIGSAEAAESVER
jgi:diaminopimelate epimerase